MAKIVRLKFKERNPEGWLSYKLEGDNLQMGPGILINRRLDIEQLQGLEPEGTQALLIIYEKNEERP